MITYFVIALVVLYVDTVTSYVLKKKYELGTCLICAACWPATILATVYFVYTEQYDKDRK